MLKVFVIIQVIFVILMLLLIDYGCVISNMLRKLRVMLIVFVVVMCFLCRKRKV